MTADTFSLAQLFGITIRESATDGSDFSNPAADYRRLFLGEDGLLHLKDSAGAVTDIGAGSLATDTLWDAAGDTVVGTGANTAVKRKNNDGTTVAPTVNEDSGDGYAIGSRWLDTTADKEYVALDVTVGAAVWVETTAPSGGALTYAVNRVETDEATNSGTFTDLATAGPAVTVTVVSAVMLTVTCGMYVNAASRYGHMGWAASGANTIAADRPKSVHFGEANDDATASAEFFLTGLSAGSTTFTAKYQSFASGQNVNFRWREISVLLLD